MSGTASGTYDRLINPVLVAGCIIILVGFSVRASFGLFQLPIALEFAWPRESFSLAIAIQNLFWGIGQPMFGAFAERYGDRKAILVGGACYIVGLLLSAYATTPGQHQWLEILVGFGIAGTGFGVLTTFGILYGQSLSPQQDIIYSALYRFSSVVVAIALSLCVIYVVHSLLNKFQPTRHHTFT